MGIVTLCSRPIASSNSIVSHLYLYLLVFALVDQRDDLTQCRRTSPSSCTMTKGVC